MEDDDHKNIPNTPVEAEELVAELTKSGLLTQQFLAAKVAEMQRGTAARLSLVRYEGADVAHVGIERLTEPKIAELLSTLGRRFDQLLHPDVKWGDVEESL